MANEVLRMEHITKVYPNGVMANKDVSLCVNEGEIHALSGENGAGKSTLMKILFGEEQATRGEIYVRGGKVTITSPMAAIKMGIGMVHQHFMLVDSLTAMENMIMGIEPTKGLLIDKKAAEEKVLEISEKYNLLIDPNAKVEDLTVGQKQKLEILKALLRDAKILILDEPTAVLTPQETRELFVELKNLRDAGHTIIFISHKLSEVSELCDRITIIRRGETKGIYSMDEVSEEDISRLMVGRDVVLKIEKKPSEPGDINLKVKNLVILNEDGRTVVDDVSFSARRGEILGVAGVEGNGQNQIVEAIVGLRAYKGGTIEIGGNSIAGASIKDLRSKWEVGHIPEDRMTMGIAPNLSLTENMLADKIDDEKYSSKMGVLKPKAMQEYGEQMVEEFGVFTQSADVAINSLSGGNIQKVVLAREISSKPELIIVDQPTRGVDVGASEFIRKMLLQMRDDDKTVFLISSDLNEVLGLSDRLLVLYAGKIAAYFPDASVVGEEELGRYMLGVEKMSDERIREALDE